MSAIPPHVAASALQSGVAQKTQAADRDNAENTKANTAKEAARAGDTLEVKATDADTQVHTDAGGLGGQGRHDAPPREEEETPEAPAEDVTFDDDGKAHLDLSA